MERRKFILGTGALATGSAFGIGTGAFTSVEADRTVDVSVAGDASALLALKPVDPNGAYVAGASNDTLELDFSNGNGAGVNDDAITVAESVFEIVNQGTNEVEVDLSSNNNSNAIIAGEPADQDPDDGVYIYFDSDGTPGIDESNEIEDTNRFDGGTDAELEVGEQIYVDVTIVTMSDSTPDAFDGDLTIEADGKDAGSGYPSENEQPS